MSEGFNVSRGMWEAKHVVGAVEVLDDRVVTYRPRARDIFPGDAIVVWCGCPPTTRRTYRAVVERVGLRGVYVVGSTARIPYHMIKESSNV